MEIRYDMNYVWWGEGVESFSGYIIDFEPNMDSKTHKHKRDKNGKLSYYMLVNPDTPSLDKYEVVRVKITESMLSGFWIEQRNKYGTITHDGNYLRFAEGEMYTKSHLTTTHDNKYPGKQQSSRLDESQIAMMFGQAPKEDENQQTLEDYGFELERLHQTTDECNAKAVEVLEKMRDECEERLGAICYVLETLRR